MLPRVSTLICIVGKYATCTSLPVKDIGIMLHDTNIMIHVHISLLLPRFISTLVYNTYCVSINRFFTCCPGFVNLQAADRSRTYVDGAKNSELTYR